MATFLSLYGDRLDRELGSADRTQLFTLARRKAAINEGMVEFARVTGCLVREAAITLVDNQSEYDLDTLITALDFAGLEKTGIELALVKSGLTTYVSGDSLTQTTTKDLNQYDPGWRGAAKGTPCQWYLEPREGKTYLGLYPAPDLTTAWTSGTLTVPYQAVPADLTLDADVPFAVAADAPLPLVPFHQALVHWAAYLLEKLRRDVDAEKIQVALFQKYVDDYRAARRPIGGARVRFARDYRRERRGGTDTTWSWTPGGPR